MLVNDILHELELGEWKTLFTHLIRILHTRDVELVHKLDARLVSSPMTSAELCIDPVFLYSTVSVK